MNTIETVIETITPAKAENLLKKNDVNRELRDATVSTYALAMQIGEWAPDANDPILISRDGTLLNGQHRLNAVIRAGIPVKMAIRYDVDPAIFAVLDQGAKRTMDDILALDIKGHEAIVAAARRMACLKHGALLSEALNGKMGANRNAASVPIKWVDIEITENRREYVRWVNAAQAVRNRIKIGGVSTYCFFPMMVAYLDRSESVDSFMEDLASEKPVNDMLYFFREHLRNRKMSGYKLTTKLTLAYLLYAYEAYREGRDLKVFKANHVQDNFKFYERMAIQKYKRKIGA